MAVKDVMEGVYGHTISGCREPLVRIPKALLDEQPSSRGKENPGREDDRKRRDLEGPESKANGGRKARMSPGAEPAQGAAAAIAAREPGSSRAGKHSECQRHASLFEREDRETDPLWAAMEEAVAKGGWDLEEVPRRGCHARHRAGAASDQFRRRFHAALEVRRDRYVRRTPPPSTTRADRACSTPRAQTVPTCGQRGSRYGQFPARDKPPSQLTFAALPAVHREPSTTWRMVHAARRGAERPRARFRQLDADAAAAARGAGGVGPTAAAGKARSRRVRTSRADEPGRDPRISRRRTGRIGSGVDRATAPDTRAGGGGLLINS